MTVKSIAGDSGTFALAHTPIKEDLDLASYIDRIQSNPFGQLSKDCPLLAITQDRRVSFRYIQDNQLVRDLAANLSCRGSNH